MDLTLIPQADRVLTACGARPIITRDGRIVPIGKGFLVPMVLQPGQSLNFTKEITGETIWALRSIESDAGMNSIIGARIQIQLPTGRYLFGGNGIDVGQFAWVGSYAYVIDPEEDCEPGSYIQVTLSDYTGLGSAIVVNLLFRGAYKNFLRGGAQSPIPQKTALQIPRYQAILSENILAPPWMGGFGPPTPKGYEDSHFVYSSSSTGQTAVALAGPLTTTLKIPIDPGYDFICHRMMFDVSADASATAGVFLGRVRNGTGYAFSEQYVDLARYLNGAEFPKGWKVKGSDAIYVDLVLADTAGTGNAYIEAHFEGARRKKVGPTR